MKPKPIHTTAEDTQINSNDEIEVQRWCQQLGVTADQLRDAVMNVGTALGDVEKELANRSEQDATPGEGAPGSAPAATTVVSDGVGQPKAP